MCACVGGGGGLWGSRRGKSVVVNNEGGVVHKNIKGPCRGSDNFYRDTIKILLIPPTPSSQVIVLNPGLFVGLFSSHEGFSCLGNLKD